VRRLIVRFATENPGWGYTRIRGALRNLGHDVGRKTIKRVLREYGIEPAPARGKRMTWATFLKTHLGVLGAKDFFTIEVLTLAGLVRYSVPSSTVIEVATRCVHIAGMARAPGGLWMLQVARNLTDAIDGFLRGSRSLIHDRHPVFTGSSTACWRLVASRPSTCRSGVRT